MTMQGYYRYRCTILCCIRESGMVYNYTSYCHSCWYCFIYIILILCSQVVHIYTCLQCCIYRFLLFYFILYYLNRRGHTSFDLYCSASSELFYSANVWTVLLCKYLSYSVLFWKYLSYSSLQMSELFYSANVWAILLCKCLHCSTVCHIQCTCMSQ
jgi:hypothetical protein